MMCDIEFSNLTSVGCLQFNSKPIVMKPIDKPFNMVPSILKYVSSKKTSDH